MNRTLWLTVRCSNCGTICMVTLGRDPVEEQVKEMREFVKHECPANVRLRPEPEPPRSVEDRLRMAGYNKEVFGARAIVNIAQAALDALHFGTGILKRTDEGDIVTIRPHKVRVEIEGD